MTPHPSTTSATPTVNDHERCPQCGFTDDLDGFDCFGADDGNLFCNRCYTEFTPREAVPMTPAERLDALHKWLWSCTKDGPETVRQMLRDLEIARLCGIPWPGVPDDADAMQRMLEQLEASGRATRDGAWWRWSQPSEKEVNKQGSLFT